MRLTQWRPSFFLVLSLSPDKPIIMNVLPGQITVQAKTV
jgi:hypothetical protein